ncbi:MAG: hypothetical protein ACUVWK_06005 [Nitrososphaerales archaeon]
MIGILYDEGERRATAILKGFVCSWNRCTFCCFYEEAAKDLDDLTSTAKSIIKKIRDLTIEKPVDRLSFFNGGSFLELPWEVIDDLSKVTKQKMVDVESRPEFLTMDSISRLYKALSPRKLVIRIGFESVNDSIRNGLLNKGISSYELKRILGLRDEVKNKFNDAIEFVAYVLFSIEGIEDESVVESVKEFKKFLDGVIAIKYRRYHKWMPKEVKASQELLRFLRANHIDVDMTESKIWKINHQP